MERVCASQHHILDEEVSALRIQSMGATRLWVSDDPDDPFVVLADPEGNEFCILRSEAELSFD